ncbi:acetyltransferase [Shewanella gelidimarina]|uniref:acetyltransferase n=1 Tax=Shewanella gelidimarina TaxID=56813 RepID=UPI00200C7EB0|nr:acetyltransferase [Shewanella gelidimarina]MCL1057801.1 acetyltransferase [Shewanella gelidimarina]
MTKSIVLLGAGGHACVLADMLLQQQREIIAVISPTASPYPLLSSIDLLSNDNDVLQFDIAEVVLVNGIGSLPQANKAALLRQRLFNEFSQLGYEFDTTLSGSAMVSPYATLESGAQVFNGAIVQTYAQIGANSIINSGAIIEHDCQIGCHNHIAPGATLSGSVHTGNNVHIGTGASIIQGVCIGANSVIAAGAIVTKDVPENSIVYGQRSHTKSRF